MGMTIWLEFLLAELLLAELLELLLAERTGRILPTPEPATYPGGHWENGRKPTETKIKIHIDPAHPLALPDCYILGSGARLRGPARALQDLEQTKTNELRNLNPRGPK